MNKIFKISAVMMASAAACGATELPDTVFSATDATEVVIDGSRQQVNVLNYGGEADLNYTYRMKTTDNDEVESFASNGEYASCTKFSFSIGTDDDRLNLESGGFMIGWNNAPGLSQVKMGKSLDISWFEIVRLRYLLGPPPQCRWALAWIGATIASPLPMSTLPKPMVCSRCSAMIPTCIRAIRA